MFLHMCVILFTDGTGVGFPAFITGHMTRGSTSKGEGVYIQEGVCIGGVYIQHGWEGSASGGGIPSRSAYWGWGGG